LTEEKKNQREEGKLEKIFTVPFALEDEKENITINANTPSKPSKEQIIWLRRKQIKNKKDQK